MENQEILEEIGIDLDSTLSRFGGNQALLLKFLKRFPEDPNFPAIGQAMELGDLQEVERAAHTLKGVAGNLGMAGLFGLCNDMVQKVRRGEADGLEALYSEAKQEYERILAGIVRL